MRKNRYVILISGMLIQFCAGIIYMWSIFRDPVAKHLNNWDANAATFTSSIMLSAFVLGIILGGRLQDKIGPNKVTYAGSLFISLGMLLTSVIPPSSPQLIYLTYGVIGGLGVGSVYTCTISTVQKWFPDKRGFATGMIVSAFGFSLVVFAPLAQYMLSAYGVPTTFRIFGFVFLAVCMVASYFIVAPEQPLQTPSASGNSPIGNQKQFTTSEMLKTKQFYLIALSMFFLLPSYFILNPLLKSLAIERGLTQETAVLGVMITGVCSAAGRLIIAWMSDKTGRKAAIMTTGVIMLAAGLLMVVANGVLFLVCVGAIAFAFGGSAGVYAAFTAECFGTKHAGMNFGCVMLAFGASALIFPPIANQLRASGGETASFIAAAVTSVIAIILMTMLKTNYQETYDSK